MSRRFALAVLVSALLCGTVRPAAADDPAADTLVLQLHGPAQFEFAGYFAALWKGFYRAEGMTVEIKPGVVRGAAPVDPVREVEDGRAQFGTGGVDLLVRSAQGMPLLLLAPVFQDSGVMIYYRADAEYPSPASLLKARVGRLPATDMLDVELVTAMRGEGIDPSRLNSVSLLPGKTVAALADRQVDAVPGSAWEFPWLARQRSLALKSFDPADYRVEFYGDTLFTSQRFARTRPDVVRRFRAASLKGWAYALDHADEIGGRMLADLPAPPGISDPAGFMRYQAVLARHLAGYPDIALGHSNPERWSRIEATLADAGALLRTTDPDAFLYDPDAAARGRTGLRDGAIVAATVVVVVIAGAVLVLRRRRALPPPPQQAAAEAPAAPPPSAPEPAPGPVPDPPVPAAPEPPRRVDLNAMLQALEPEIRQRVPPPASLRFSLLPDLWQARVDTAAIGALVLDLVSAANADNEHTDDLIIGTRNYRFDAKNLAETPGAMPGEFARITIRDNGRGLSGAALERVFDPSVTRRPAVAAAWPLLRKYGGFTRVESAEGVGTAVHLYLPRAAADAGEEPPPAGRRYRSGARSTQRRSRSLR